MMPEKNYILPFNLNGYSQPPRTRAISFYNAIIANKPQKIWLGKLQDNNSNCKKLYETTISYFGVLRKFLYSLLSWKEIVSAIDHRCFLLILAEFHL
jgi:hypothetical protein